MKNIKLVLLILGSFLVAGFGFTVFDTEQSNFKESVNSTESEIANFGSDFKQLVDDQEFWTQVSFKNDQQLAALESEKLAFYLFVYQDSKLVFWNTNAVLPPVKNDQIDEGGTLLKLKNGYYIARKEQQHNLTFVALQSIKSDFAFQNRYLSNSYTKPYSFDPSIQLVQPSFAAGQSVLNENGKVLFKVIFEHALNQEANPKGVLISYFTFVIMLVILGVVLFEIKNRQPSWVLLLALMGAVILVKVSVAFVPFEFLKTNLFGPELYASNFWGSSLGHLFLNVLLLTTCVVVLIRSKVFEMLGKTLQKVMVNTLTFGMTWVYLSIISSLIIDSTISFEINNFTILNGYTFIGLFVVLLVNYAYFLLIQELFKVKASEKFSVRFWMTIAIAGLNYWIFYWFTNSLIVGLAAFCSFCVLGALYLFGQRKEKKIGLYALFLTGMFMASVISAVVIEHYNHEKIESKSLALAKQLADQRDFIAEYRFDEVYQDIKGDPFVKKFFGSPLISSKDLNQRLQFLYFDGHLSKYNIEGLAFNAEGKLIKNAEVDSLEQYYELINTKGEMTFSEELFFIPQAESKLSYISILAIENNGKFAGSLVIKMSPKTYQKDNLYPELLIEEKKQPVVTRSTDHVDYAIYFNGVLSAQAGEFPYPYRQERTLSADLEFEIYDSYQHKHLVYQETPQLSVVVSHPEESLIMPISIFSYLLCFFLITSIVVIGVLVLTSKLFDLKSMAGWINVSFRNRINFAMIAIIVSSFVIIGIITVRYFSDEYDNYHEQRLVRKQKAVLSALEYTIQENKFNQEVSIQELFQLGISNEVAALSDIHSMDINIFDLKGDLIISSQPGIFSNGLIAKKINPDAYFTIQGHEVERFIQEEKIGVLNYLAIYVPVRNALGEEIAYLNLPYFAKEENMRKEISEFMVALVNVYVFLLVIAGIIAFLVSNSITSPLAEISRKLRLVNLSKKNEEIVWETNDEIGALVKEYNRMISQLEQSAKLLASSERESAWREMARQIAHEIKNPLTPMKLSIQHLQRAVQNEPERAAELAQKVANTLIEQIGNLAEIATAFSSFAKMPKANKEILELKGVLKNIASLFNEKPNANIVFESKVDEAIIFADKNQMISVFNNLVKNAVQATEEVDDPKIVVQLLQDDDLFRVEISDNGVGISESMKSKVFVPNFTTKSSGTGLGLAISKQIVENSVGSIFFKSEENKGTTFTVVLPKFKA